MPLDVNVLILVLEYSSESALLGSLDALIVPAVILLALRFGILLAFNVPAVILLAFRFGILSDPNVPAVIYLHLGLVFYQHSMFLMRCYLHLLYLSLLK